ncbi:hypothetical protein POTOM_050489 [Populus tomentosa]|uniref:Uncharacterized protein n=1 Tax=Populus tomentosa TaxID=118781 RepID=A0A8X7Y894_POPTO|nr:hypothetical protein POTOM_050489 [Populus tomentosa]
MFKFLQKISRTYQLSSKGHYEWFTKLFILQLLAEDPALKWFKSHKKSVWRLKRAGDVLTLVVVAGCCYEIYVKAVMREEARKEAKKSA